MPYTTKFGKSALVTQSTRLKILRFDWLWQFFLHISRCSFCTSLCSAKYKLHTVGFTNTKITIFFYIFQGVRLVQVFAVQNTNCTVLVYEHQDHDFFTYFKVFLLYKSLSAKRKLHSVGFMNTKITIFYIFQGVHLVKVFAVQNANCTVLVLRTPRSRFFLHISSCSFSTSLCSAKC